MNLSRRLLFASAFWEVARPRTALNAGHLLIRLTNPAIAFDLRSAADWLTCHNAARLALAEVLEATAVTVMFAHQWHPIGAAIGEPEVESSTPTFHLFGRWEGESVSPGEQLRLPAQRRVPAAAADLLKYDGGLRTALRRAALAAPAEADRQSASPGAVDGPLAAVVAAPPTLKAGMHHTVLSPASEDPLAPGHLLSLAAAVQALTDRPGVTGLSCVVPEPAAGSLAVHALGRSAGESVNPMQEFLDLPGVSRALL